MSDFFLDALGALSGDEFDERPVDLKTFVTSEEYLGLPPLSDIQMEFIGAMSNIYRLQTLQNLFGEEKGWEIHKQTCNEIILMLGKGSGKDYCSSIACAFIVYMMLCLKDPAAYYGKPKGDDIHILNIAINAEQAKNVFFKNMLRRVEESPWFEGRYYPKQNSIEFDKNITVHSGHSERESWEGYNTFMVILDEISGFALDSPSGGENAKTASAIYKMYRASVTSRYSAYGKLVLLSFPRYKNDFISQRYDAEVAEKETVLKQYTVKRDPDLPDGTPNNEFTIEWEHDIILRYKSPKVYCLRRTTWEVNPTKFPEDYTRDFFDDPGDAYCRVACMPSTLTDGFFKNKEKIANAFAITNGVDEDGVFLDKLQAKPDTDYFIHVDLAQKHDRCAVALGHVESWKEVGIGSETGYKETLPVVIIDALRYWTPTKDKSIDFKDVTDYILALRRRGFNVKLTTFDRWNSHDTMNYLESMGMPTGTLSVAKKHYDDFLSIMYDDRLLGPKDEILIDELEQLRIIKDKVDHPTKSGKDLSDAVCGAIFNAVAHTKRPVNEEITPMTVSDLRRQARPPEAPKKDGVIRPPSREPMPSSLAEYVLNNFRTL